MSKLSHSLTGLLVLLFSSQQACIAQVDTLQGGQEPATILRFRVQEPGVNPYPVKYTITDRFVRVDDDSADAGFILLDRPARTVYSVSRDEHTVLVLPPPPHAQEPPDSYRPDTATESDHQAPSVGGRQPLHLTLKANGRTCTEVIAVPGLLPAATTALRDFARLTGERQQPRLKNLPADIRTPCYLERYAYGTELPYQHGFPIREWSADGYGRELIDYRENSPVDTAEFRLPQGYRRIHMPVPDGGEPTF